MQATAMVGDTKAELVAPPIEPIGEAGMLLDDHYELLELAEVAGRVESWRCRWGKRQGYAALVHAGEWDTEQHTVAKREFMLRAGRLGATDRAAWLTDERLLGYAIFEDYSAALLAALEGDGATEVEEERSWRAGMTEFFVFMVRDPRLLGLCLLAALLNVVWSSLTKMPQGMSFGVLAVLKWVLLLLAQWLGAAAIFIGLVLRYYAAHYTKVKKTKPQPGRPYSWTANAGWLGLGAVVAVAVAVWVR